MLYVKPSSGACQRLSGSYDSQISNLNTNVNKFLSRYQLISADIYSAVCPEIAKGTEKVISITIKRHVNNTMLILTIRSTGYLNIREMEWGPEGSVDINAWTSCSGVRSKIHFLTTIAI